MARKDIKFELSDLGNKTLLASIFNLDQEEEYDYKGALIYVSAVVLIYGMSIVLMIVSFIRRSRAHDSVEAYFKELKKVQSTEKQIAKCRLSWAMEQTAMKYPGIMLNRTQRDAYGCVASGTDSCPDTPASLNSFEFPPPLSETGCGGGMTSSSEPLLQGGKGGQEGATVLPHPERADSVPLLVRSSLPSVVEVEEEA